MTAAARWTVSALGRLILTSRGLQHVEDISFYRWPTANCCPHPWSGRWRWQRRPGIEQPLGGTAILVARCYRTVSGKGSQILIRMPPTHFLAEEQRRIEERRLEATKVAFIRRQEVALRESQELWNHMTKPGVDSWYLVVGVSVKAWKYVFSHDPSIIRTTMIPTNLRLIPAATTARSQRTQVSYAVLLSILGGA